MIGRYFPLDKLALVIGVVWASGTCPSVAAQEHSAAASGKADCPSLHKGTVPFSGSAAADCEVRPSSSACFCVDKLPAHVRSGVRLVLEHPTLQTRGPTEVFRGNPTIYHWLLDHPDRGVNMWRQLGAKCMEIKDRGNGRFGCSDGQGSDLHWETVHQGPCLRVWYAEGEARPGPLLPAVLVRAVVVLRYQQDKDGLGRTILHQQADLFLQTDSKAVALAAKLMGASAPQLARQCVGQMELFFSFPVAYLDRHPERTQAFLIGGLPTDAPAAKELRHLLGKS